MSTDSVPVHFGVALFPGFQALDVFGPLDALNILAIDHTIQLHILAPTLSPVSTETFKNPNSNSAQSVVPTHTYANPPEKLDVLLVPGGAGTRADEVMAPVIAFIASVYPSLKYLVTVCTGSTIVARAGILDGRKATTNKRSWQWAVALGPKVDWVTHARWVVDGNIYTSSGVSAGIDAMLAFMEDVYGAQAAKTVAEVMEYERHTDPTQDPFADLYGL